MDEKINKGEFRKMRRVKQVSIDSDLPELTSAYPETSIYIMNGDYLTREEFISQVALSLYINEPNTDIRKTIELLLKDGMNELVCSGGDKFCSYITNGEGKHSRQGDFDGDIVEKDMEQEEHPLKTYKVSYDILIVPTISIFQRGKTYKRSEEIVQATSFRQAKEMTKQKLTDLGKVTKSFTVELVNTEV